MCRAIGGGAAEGAGGLLDPAGQEFAHVGALKGAGFDEDLEVTRVLADVAAEGAAIELIDAEVLQGRVVAADADAQRVAILSGQIADVEAPLVVKLDIH